MSAPRLNYGQREALRKLVAAGGPLPLWPGPVPINGNLLNRLIRFGYADKIRVGLISNAVITDAGRAAIAKVDNS